MTNIYEKQIWCGGCRRNHIVKLYSQSTLNEYEKARFFVPGDYAEHFMKHCVCGGCGGNITPHADIDIVASEGEWKEICLKCFRDGGPA